MTYCINNRKNKNYMIISIIARKVFGKIQYSFFINFIIKVGVERIDVFIIKKNDKPTANIIFNGENLKAFPLKSRQR